MLDIDTIKVIAHCGSDRSQTILEMAGIAFSKKCDVTCSFNGREILVSKSDVGKFITGIEDKNGIIRV